MWSPLPCRPAARRDTHRSVAGLPCAGTPANAACHTAG
jgi:hypothetical protein